MTKIKIWHDRRKYLVLIEDGKIQVKRPGWIIKWNANTQETENVARLLGQVLREIWPQALRQEILNQIQTGH